MVDVASNGQTSRGSTLIEVLLALSVLAIGIAGVAQLSLQGLASESHVALRERATALLADAQELLQAQATGPATDPAQTMVQLMTVAAVHAPQAQACAARDDCSAAALAEQQLSAWFTDVARSRGGLQLTPSAAFNLLSAPNSWPANLHLGINMSGEADADGAAQSGSLALAAHLSTYGATGPPSVAGP